MSDVEIPCERAKLPHIRIIDGNCTICIRDDQIDRLKGKVDIFREEVRDGEVEIRSLKARVASLEKQKDA
jgi:hypothetical protein